MIDRKSHAVTRRCLLGAGVVQLAAVTAAGRAALAAVPARPLRLRIENLHTGETLDCVFAENGRLLPDALAEIDWIMRDWRTGEQRPIDRELLVLLDELHRRMDSTAPFQLISGYRSPKTNAQLASTSNGVARKSLHLVGKAADIALPDRSLTSLRETALAMQRGGVGFYPESGFVHVDTGRVRFW